MKPQVTTDQVTLTVIDNYLTSTCRDMGVTMMTTAYSPIFNESLDFSCVIFDPEGQMIAQAEFCPSQIGTIKFTVTWMIAELGLDVFEEGDVILHNDPYRGTGHVPEHMLLRPVFWEGEIVAFVANVAHISEIGAKTPGGLTGDATEIFQEGLRLPPVKIKSRGEDVEDVWKIVLSNHRTPQVTYGDFRAMIGSLDLAERRLHKLIDDYGLDVVREATRELQAVSERRMRAEIEQIPDGEYSFEDVIEDDGISEGDYPMKLALTVDGGEVIADFTGSARQAVGPVNAIYAVTASAIYNAFLHLTDPTIPRNEGCYRPITIIAPPGTIVNCKFPAPVVGGNTEISPRLTDMVFGALRTRSRIVWRPRAAGPRPPSCSAAATRARVSRTPTSTSRASAGAAATARTATTWSSPSTATAATRRWRSSRRATRLPYRVVPARARLRWSRRVPGRPRRRAHLHRHRPGGHRQRPPQPHEDRARGVSSAAATAPSEASGCAARVRTSGARSSRSSARCPRRSSPA